MRAKGSGIRREVAPWGKTEFIRRVNDCRIFLYMHGFIGDKENFRVKKGIKKAILDEAKSTKEDDLQCLN